MKLIKIEGLVWRSKIILEQSESQNDSREKLFSSITD